MKRFFIAAACGVLLLVGLSGPVRGQSAPSLPPPPGAIPPPPPPPNFATATPTPTATPTATPIPLFLITHVAHASVKVGQKQKITVDTLPAVATRITLRFPNGHKAVKIGTTGSNGTLSWTFKQPAGTTTAKSRTVKVAIKVTDDTTQASLSKNRTYRVG